MSEEIEVLVMQGIRKTDSCNNKDYLKFTLVLVEQGNCFVIIHDMNSAFM